ncbi:MULTISPECIES: aldehyde dehydrogenase family protein [Alcaligenes]|jgi:acetaldehyde dehydrogenase/alcohol dehydrogenase|uniref:Aldehyde dehydrogenase domain-containing protein n=1 Tax=Alcaligenes faecalis TaxID=511 RepID=A0AB33CRJ2_ALCFA|nr:MULTISPECIES: aldehyde dehydrogenase family protein [Alcaligenes]ASR89133.1 hypothetical protein AFA_06560 [Alcaligenes faecalis]MCC9163174.1 aldehyde dehydrogenase family protein [Alcaligenes sp. MMA]
MDTLASPEHSLADSALVTVQNAVQAQPALEQASDEQIDALITDIAQAFEQKLEYWAQTELDATRIGNLPDKIHKLGLVTDRVYRELYGEKTYGRLHGSKTFIEYASPVGVIFAIVPLTNPVPNSLFKTLLSLKTRNALILSYPRKSDQLGAQVVATVQAILKKHHLPETLIQAVQTPSRETTQLIMQSDQVSLILATGGGDLVKTAYSSGTPAIGVGPGNVPVYVSASADLSQAADDILQGKTYDNGIVCGSESNIIIDERVYEEFVEILKQKGALLISEKQHIDALFDDSTGRLHRTLIGVDAMTLAKQMDVDSPTPIKLILIAADPEQHAFLSREKMAPIVTLYKSEAGQGISLAAQLLWQEGAGHSAVIHSKDQDEIHQFASTLPAGRILVNMPATQGMLGISSDIPLSFMQGSGSWGGNISTEPVHWRHLVNIKRLTFKK